MNDCLYLVRCLLPKKEIGIILGIKIAESYIANRKCLSYERADIMIVHTRSLWYIVKIINSPPSYCARTTLHIYQKHLRCVSTYSYTTYIVSQDKG